jgi:hypothetical protein
LMEEMSMRVPPIFLSSHATSRTFRGLEGIIEVVAI